jgi:hypothetical protein
LEFTEEEVDLEGVPDTKIQIMMNIASPAPGRSPPLNIPMR